MIQNSFNRTFNRKLSDVTDKAVVTRDDKNRKHVNGYTFKHNLGKGSYGKVKLCEISGTNRLCAVKICDKSLLNKKELGKSKSKLDDVKKEIAIMKNLDHPNIIKVIEIVDDPDHNKLYMFMEYAANSPIMSGKFENEPLDENIAHKYFCDIISGVEYLHMNNIIHRDIKPENILVTDNNKVKIADFGVSRIFTDENDVIKTLIGTPAFYAPEMFSENGKSYDCSVDLWACGITLYCMVYGTVPFKSRIPKLFDEIINRDIVFPPTPTINDDLKDLILKLLKKNPKERITLNECMYHPWINKNGFERSESSIISISNGDIDHAITNVNEIELTVRINKKLKNIINKKNVKNDNHDLSNTNLKVIDELYSQETITKF